MFRYTVDTAGFLGGGEVAIRTMSAFRNAASHQHSGSYVTSIISREDENVRKMLFGINRASLLALTFPVVSVTSSMSIMALMSQILKYFASSIITLI